MFRTVAILLFTLGLSLPVAAITLEQAMDSLGAAKAEGLVGEQPDGYLGVVRNAAEAAAVVQKINEARRTEYYRVAQQNGIAVADVEAIAGQKAMSRTPPGQFVQRDGRWIRK